MSARYTVLSISRRFFCDKGPRKFKNFSEMAQGISEVRSAFPAHLEKLELRFP